MITILGLVTIQGAVSIQGNMVTIVIHLIYQDSTIYGHALRPSHVRGPQELAHRPLFHRFNFHGSPINREKRENWTPRELPTVQYLKENMMCV